jgi:Phosphohistidine phosphatase SixA
MGEEMAERALAPELVVCSTSTRTRQTLERWLMASKMAPEIIFAKDLYHASPSVMLDIVKKIAPGHGSVMLLGHNPGMEQFAMQIAADLSSKAAKSMMEKFPTAALAVFDLPNKSWADMEPGTGTLTCYLTPRQLISENSFAEI